MLTHGLGGGIGITGQSVNFFKQLASKGRHTQPHRGSRCAAAFPEGFLVNRPDGCQLAGLDVLPQLHADVVLQALNGRERGKSKGFTGGEVT